MARKKSNQGLVFIKDTQKSYVYINERGKNIGILMWNYQKKKWILDNA